MSQPSMKLVHVLIGKSIAETILVGALATYFFFTAFPPYFRGDSEVAGQAIAGWAVDSSAPGKRVDIQLFIDGEFVASGIANQFRPDVRAAGWAVDDWHGYIFTLTPLARGLHVGRTYALHESGGGARQTLQMLGGPVYFFVDENGKLAGIVKGK